MSMIRLRAYVINAQEDKKKYLISQINLTDIRIFTRIVKLISI
jgi:hypothetical protein